MGIEVAEENTRSRMSLSGAVSQLNDYASKEERFLLSNVSLEVIA